MDRGRSACSPLRIFSGALGFMVIGIGLCTASSETDMFKAMGIFIFIMGVVLMFGGIARCVHLKRRSAMDFQSPQIIIPQAIGSPDEGYPMVDQADFPPQMGDHSHLSYQPQAGYQPMGFQPSQPSAPNAWYHSASQAGYEQMPQTGYHPAKQDVYNPGPTLEYSPRPREQPPNGYPGTETNVYPSAPQQESTRLGRESAPDADDELPPPPSYDSVVNQK